MLIIVLITLVFASLALVTFMDKATNDLLVEHREVRGQRLRMEAYSALETTLSVLEEFRQVSGGLHSPAEGWGDPLGFAEYTPSEGRVVEVSFEDESGKLSLPQANMQVMSRLFQFWEVPQADADVLADNLMGWMKRDHIYATTAEPSYDQGVLPYVAPLRPLRSYTELAAIDKVREFFYDADGHPNDNWRRFVASVSLFNFNKTNINGAKPEALAALGQYDEVQQQNLTSYIAGTGAFQVNGPQVIKEIGEAQLRAGGQGGNLDAFTTTISALRIVITVREGKTEFRLAAVVTYGGAAKTVQDTATTNRKETSSSAAQKASDSQTTPNAQKTSTSRSTGKSTQTSANQNLRYPFTLLEIRENDEIPPLPSPPAPEGAL
ncbi:type II secretion system protein GspK [Opitutus sp. ER46]|uniref:general secretion pathway protein GspK n=1 Tax=Opitutus sp. ER46 TaxID=2161864 RepID=UPI000D30ED4D|nr:type II secretion system protein GspK [Opitutus sp. ER46]PTX91643.1 hypothetical protein DB354_17390 [Opitutus sp. ER46]